jgi:CheY-like chemotaxis protein
MDFSNKNSLMTERTLKGRTILVVEDDPASRLYLNKILERAEVSVLNAEDGQQAVDVAMEHPEIEFILMDIQLPVQDGYTTAKKIRQFRNKVIIIAQTAYGLMDEKQKIMESGFDDYLIKPIISTALLEKLNSLLDRIR